MACCTLQHQREREREGERERERERGRESERERGGGGGGNKKAGSHPAGGLMTTTCTVQMRGCPCGGRSCDTALAAVPQTI